MAAPQYFPLLVEGSWGPHPPKGLTTKLQLYFQSQKRSGGGECEVQQEPGSPARFLVLFHLLEVRQNVLERENHELAWPGKGTFKLTVKLPPASNEVHDASKEKIPANESKTKEDAKEPDASEDTQMSIKRRSEKMEVIPKQCENIPFLVAFENLKANVNDIMLTLLVQNISGLSSDDFQVEVIQDFDVGVVTFRKYLDAMKFVEDCATHHSVIQLQLSPRLLEMTKTVRVENLPPGVDSYNLKCLFENPQNGGGRVVSIEYFPEESSALIEFFDRKVLDTIMTKKLDLNNMPLSVFPYYTSLGTALYGKEKPLIKFPAPFKESLDLSLWKFLQKRNHLIEEINEEVRHSHCELSWHPLKGEITIRPAATLVNQGRKRIKNWKKDASTAFFSIRSRFKVTPLKVDPVVWDIMKNDLEDERLLIEFDTDMGIVALVGKSEDVENFEPQIKELMEKATEKIKREEQCLKEKVAISPRKYSLLCHSGVQERLRREYPEMEIFYDKATQHMCFKGLGVDVYKAKCEVQEKVFTMDQKSIQLPPEVFQFLQQVDCSELSKSLFIAQKILAVYELEGTTVFLTGCSSEVLLKAEKQMLSALSYKRIDVEDREVLNSKKWKTITNNLPKKHNSSSKTVMINELTSGTTAEVIIAGCVREVNEIYNVLLDFVGKNTKIERFHEVKPSLVIDYLKAEKKLFLQKIKMNKLNVQVEFNPRNKPKGILLTGSKAEVLEGMILLKQARDSVCVKSISIDKPGASQSFQDKPWYYKREVRSCGCFVELLQNEQKEGGGSDGQKCSCRTELAPGVSLIVQQGDLTRFPVEVVVNAANEDLRLSGGLAAALSKAAGPELQADCDRIVKEKGKIPVGHATISKPGKLPYHQVIHAVGPKWDSNDVVRCVLQLKNAVKRSLNLADNFQYQSIAIPAISSGDGGFPLAQCVEAIVLAIKESFQYNSAGNTLKEVYLVDLAGKIVEAFAETVKTVFKNNKPGTASLPSVPAGVQLGPRNDDGNRQMLLCPGGLRIQLVKGDVQNSMADVVVNFIPRDLNLNSGPLSQALLAKAGPNLQKELYEAAQAIAVDVGMILQTAGQSVSNQVLHVVVPSWKDGNTSSYKIMRDIIRKCLEITENMHFNSIVFLAIGTGNLGFPKTVFAELIISEVFKFCSNNQPTALQEVCFLLHPSDHGNIQAFSDEFQRRDNGNSISDRIPKAQNIQGLYGTVTSPASGVQEMKFGPITFQVATGDIAKEEADVIVNSTTKTFDHKAGVSKAILEKAGQNVEIECSHQAQQHNNGYIITDGGALKCKNIIHVAGGADVKTSVTCVLQECEKRNYSTICLPAIGTGSAQQDPDKVAEAIMDAIEDFFQKGLVRSVKKVEVAIIKPQIMDVFCANMKKREGSPAPPQSIVSKIASLYGTITSPTSGVQEMKIGPITFQVATGDIAKEEADVIVNSTTKTFNHKAGVSKAILEKAGQNVEIECSRLAQQHNNGYIITHGGALKCKNIIHVDGGADVKTSVTCVLQECEKRNYSTICLPAIGTGSAQQDPDKVAEAIMDAIEDFIQKGLVRSVKKVKVVIFQPQLMDVFGANMKKREGSQAPSQSVVSKIASLYGTITSPTSGVQEMKIGPITFQVATGDIAKEEADVIVNSTTKTFNHKAGVSKAILEKAGQIVEIECSRLAQQHNNGYIITHGGALKCKNIIHVDGGADVKTSVTCVLQECEKRNYSTICLPAIGTGSAQQDPDKVAEAIMDAIEGFFQKGLVQSVKKVKVVIFQPQIMDVFSANMKKREGSLAPSQSIVSKIASLYGTITSPTSGVQEMKIGPITFQVATGDIAKEEADVIVNSTTKTFNHKAGVSKAILEKAGQIVEIECSRLAQQHNNGYIITHGGALKCKNIIHVDGGADVKTSVTCVLQECEKRNYSTICLPAIGTGSAQQDPDKVAEAIMDAIEGFSQKGLVRSVKKVKVVIFQPQIMDVFCANMKKREGSLAPSQSIVSKIASLYGTVTSPASGVQEMKIGSITLQVATRDITEEEADVIVNSTTKTFDCKAGVSKAILEKAGQNVEIECSHLAQQHNNGYIITDGGALKCKNIIHVDGGADVKRSVSCVLQECEKRNYSTICLPAIGTGSAQQDPDKVAEAIMDAIEDFSQKGLVRSVKKVKVVIFQPQLMDVFCANMKKREGSLAPSQSIMSEIAPYFGFSKQPSPPKKPLVLEKKKVSAIFQVCGENETCVQNAISCLQTLMEKEQSLYTSAEECIKDFDEKEYQELNKLQKDLNIFVDLDHQKPLIKVSGISRDVEQARNAVEEMIKTVRSAKEQESRADCITDFVEWQYEDNNTFCSFDKITNLKLEEARKKQRQTIDVQINNQNYTVDVKTCIATGANRHSLQILRIAKPQVEIPGHWSDMKQQSVCLVELQPGQPEYRMVAGAFNQTCLQFKIEKIERIQNPSLWQHYQTKKKTMDDKNGQIQNEKLLFHGTDADSLPHVNQHGFNRSYAGKNAAAYGKGTYFAVQALYSAKDRFSRPDANGKKHMYYVRVLTGLYTYGNKSFLVPPAKNPQNPLDLYDTVTDNVSRPKLFVVFYDYQAYPEYLITFTE